MSKDIAVEAIGGGTSVLNIGVPISRKPSYILLLSKMNKGSEMFITVDKPDFVNGFIQVKGFFSELTPADAIKNINEVLTSTNKDLICEVYFPTHRVVSLQSVFYKHK